MSRHYKYQDDLIDRLAQEWIKGWHLKVRKEIHGLKNKSQAAYIAASVCLYLLVFDEETNYATDGTQGESGKFLNYINPNNRSE